MFASKLILPAAWLLLLGTVSAAPAADKLDARQGADPVDSKTVTTILTTTDGTPTVVPGAAHDPHDVTTTTEATSTDDAQPKKGGAGGPFAACHNTGGEFMPFCLPKNNDIFYPGSTHYITWNPDFFPGDNTTVQIIGFYTPNTTTTAHEGPVEEEEVFTSDHITSTWGYYQWHLDKSVLNSHKVGAANITVRMAALTKNGGGAQWYTGPTIMLTWKPKKPSKHAHQAPDTEALVYVLPIVLTLALFMVIGSSVWNRRARHIDLGDLMRAAGRRKNKSRGKRAVNKGKGEEGIRLMERDGFSSGEEDGGGGWKKRID